ncbi:MAG: crosslink repair DNA glycosylase YcaQ family protein [Saprospiraceae bacterium]
MQKLPLHTAQHFILHSQLLAPNTGLSGKEGTLQAIRHLGYVQIDTISVVARAHHHVLWTRVPDYQPDHLQELDREDRAVFDYWAHAASYLPMEDYRFSLIRKKSMDNGNGFWRLDDPELAAHVIQRIQQEGALMSKDFVRSKERPDEPWRIPAINMVIRQLFMKGELMAAGRKGILKTYDLPERVLPEGIATDLPTEQEYIEHLIRRDLRAHGLVKLSEFGYLLKIKRQAFHEVIKKMIQTGEVVEVEINSLSKESYFVFQKSLTDFSPTNKKQFHILSPFDNLVIQRKRLSELFGFDYTIECYVPEAKRKFGYYGLPLLFGTQFVGQLDAKADRKNKILILKNLEWTEKPTQVMLRAFDKKLKAFAKFCGCEEVKGLN